MSAEAVLNEARARIGNDGSESWDNYDAHTSGLGHVAWCAEFCCLCFERAGEEFNYSASAAGFAAQFDRISDEEAGPGDIVFFGWDGIREVYHRDSSHVAIVEEWVHTDDYFSVIEGNSGNGGCEDTHVARTVYNNEDNFFTAFFRPNYSGGQPEPEPEPEPVKTWGAIQVEPNMTDSQLVRLNQNGDYFEIEFRNGQVLDVRGGTDAGPVEDGREVWAHDRNGTDAQLWRLEESGVDNAYWLVPKIADGYTLDNLHGAVAGRNNLALWHKQDSMDDRYAQSWRVIPSHVDGWSVILNAKSEYALDANPNGYNYE